MTVFGDCITDTEGGRYLPVDHFNGLPRLIGWRVCCLSIEVYNPFVVYICVIGIKTHPKQVYVESPNTHLSYRYSHFSVIFERYASCGTDQLSSFVGRLTSLRGFVCPLLHHTNLLLLPFHYPNCCFLSFQTPKAGKLFPELSHHSGACFQYCTTQLGAAHGHRFETRIAGFLPPGHVACRAAVV